MHPCKSYAAWLKPPHMYVYIHTTNIHTILTDIRHTATHTAYETHHCTPHKYTHTPHTHTHSHTTYTHTTHTHTTHTSHTHILTHTHKLTHTHPILSHTHTPHILTSHTHTHITHPHTHTHTHHSHSHTHTHITHTHTHTHTHSPAWSALTRWKTAGTTGRNDPGGGPSCTVHPCESSCLLCSRPEHELWGPESQALRPDAPPSRCRQAPL